jgi:hypothetical protein
VVDAERFDGTGVEPQRIVFLPVTAGPYSNSSPCWPAGGEASDLEDAPAGRRGRQNGRFGAGDRNDLAARTHAAAV